MRLHNAGTRLKDDFSQHAQSMRLRLHLLNSKQVIALTNRDDEEHCFRESLEKLTVPEHICVIAVIAEKALQIFCYRAVIFFRHGSLQAIPVVLLSSAEKERKKDREREREQQRTISAWTPLMSMSL